jgi:hypothetical protein
MSRYLPGVLAAACLVLGALNLVVYSYGQREPRPPAEPRTAWERWQLLDIGQREQLIRLYQRYSGRADAREAFRRAEAFAELPRRRQDQLRALCRAFYEIVDALPANEQRSLLRSQPRARAVFVYWHLRSTNPARLQQLRQSVLDAAGEAGTPATAP